MYSFESEVDTCPHCRADLFRADSVTLDGRLATVEQDGEVWEAYNRPVVLETQCPEVKCTSCGGVLKLLWIQEERKC